MKKIILAVLMVVMVTTPCFAQELEPLGLFSIGGTTWRRIGVAIAIFDSPFISLYDDTVYFTEKSIFTSSGNIGILSNVYTYLDFLVFSVASESRYGIMILQPAIGVGFYGQLVWIAMPSQGSSVLFNGPVPPLRFGLNFGYMIKIDDDDWTPPEDEPPTE